MSNAINVNIDPSNAPSWLVLILAALTFAAEMVDHTSRPNQTIPGMDAPSCFGFCGGWVQEWTPYTCKCNIPAPK